MTTTEIAPLAEQLPSWEVIEGHHLRREYRFDDFKQALAFVNAVGAEAEAQGHHPDLELAWGKVGVRLYTHKIDGLARADFIMAARIEGLFEGGSAGAASA